MGNSESKPPQSNPPEHQETIPTNVLAVSGDTEKIMISSPKPSVTRAAFESTSENNFTPSEHVVPVPVSAHGSEHKSEHKSDTLKSTHNTNVNSAANPQLIGGFDLSFIFNNLSNILQDTEMDGGVIDNEHLNTHLSKINELLQDTESAPQSGGITLDQSHLEKIRELLNETETNNLVGGNSNPMINKLRDLLLQDTETNFINFKGGALEKTNLFSENKLTEVSEKSDKSHSEAKEHEKHKEHKEDKEEVEKKELNEKPEEEEDMKTDQSGGEKLDTELKGILHELQTNNKNLDKYKGGKSSKKSSKKSAGKSSKKQSRRSSEASNASNNTYNIDSDDSDVDDYLTSTSSMNTSDINIKHYRS
jgi:hypothetical protein